MRSSNSSKINKTEIFSEIESNNDSLNVNTDELENTVKRRVSVNKISFPLIKIRTLADVISKDPKHKISEMSSKSVVSKIKEKEKAPPTRTISEQMHVQAESVQVMSPNIQRVFPVDFGNDLSQSLEEEEANVEYDEHCAKRNSIGKKITVM